VPEQAARSPEPQAGAAAVQPKSSYVIPRPWPACGCRRRCRSPGQIGAFGSTHQAKLGWRYMVRAYPAVAHLPSGRQARPKFEGADFLSLSDRDDVAGSFGGAVPAHAGDRLQLRSGWPPVEIKGRAMSDERVYEEPLPWLAPVEDEDEPRGYRRDECLRRCWWWCSRVDRSRHVLLARSPRDDREWASPELIKAEAGPYKVKPTDQAGSTSVARARRRSKRAPARTRGSQLDLNKLPETPVAKPPKVEPAAPPANEAPVAAQTPEAKPTGGSGSVVQLGAFANQAQAERAWTALSARFPGVAALSKMIVPFSGESACVPARHRRLTRSRCARR
jgi:cell division septation protein DedD